MSLNVVWSKTNVRVDFGAAGDPDRIKKMLPGYEGSIDLDPSSFSGISFWPEGILKIDLGIVWPDRLLVNQDAARGYLLGEGVDPRQFTLLPHIVAAITDSVCQELWKKVERRRGPRAVFTTSRKSTWYEYPDSSEQMDAFMPLIRIGEHGSLFGVRSVEREVRPEEGLMVIL